MNIDYLHYAFTRIPIKSRVYLPVQYVSFIRGRARQVYVRGDGVVTFQTVRGGALNVCCGRPATRRTSADPLPDVQVASRGIF